LFALTLRGSVGLARRSEGLPSEALETEVEATAPWC